MLVGLGLHGDARTRVRVCVFAAGGLEVFLILHMHALRTRPQ